ncbi:TfuA-like protein [Streptomyces sp. NPDC007901]|uniref:TfuA-like protein n=1 Tax=Streptomyces sp. NPDC007901 TaxID=3364785 RepID=UPI0036F02B7D
MPRAYCFVGPSLPDAAELAAGSGITVLPPVAAGDLLRLDVEAGDIVGIVDGYFHQTGAVRHKEIMYLLSRGVRVLGAASMGALRAAELDRFGMEGIGDIYADYRDGHLEADDEVTLLHSPPEEGYRAHSEPLVCMRATFAEAVQHGVCKAQMADRLLDVLSQRPFGLRSYSALPEAGAEAGLDAAAVQELRRYCTAHRSDPKRADALLLLQRLRIAAVDAGSSSEHPPVHRTSFLYTWQLVARKADAGQDISRSGGLGLLRACQLFADDYPVYHRNMVLSTLARQCARECQENESQGTDAERALRHGEHRGLYRLPADRERLGFLDQWLTPAEARLPLPEQLTAFLVRSCSTTLLLPWEEMALDLLTERSMLTSAQQFVSLAWEVNDRVLADRPDLSLDTLVPTKIRDLLAERWKLSSTDLGVAALDRGFTSIDHAITAARPFYLFARYNQGTARLRLASPQRLTQ